ncbi:hypothetical protein [Bacillus suaedaesalsae]|uniref:DUF4129 domain-containing protein n=1 Tax=Bacillus suaedaesalsae TaxID=2810349 RepID=A0ABS2DJP8_9BACI|nr:hypothetical protein [Bacillus suaedaesalsae]MBM6617713.1 hypothetical protein [Bacillus suaedaesalsae]
MLKKYGKDLLLFTFICTFEIISLYIISRIVTDTITFMTLFPIYIIPFVLVRWYQLKSGSLPALYIYVPFLQIFILYFAGFSILALMIVGVFIFWRMIVHIREPYLDNQGLWLVAVLASTFPILLVRKEFLLDFVSLFLLLLFLFVVITVMIQMKGNAWVIMKKGYRILTLYFIGVVGVFLLLYHSGLTLLKAVFPFFGQGVAYLASYPLMWLLSTIKTNEDSYKDIEEGLKEFQEDPMKNIDKSFEGSNEWLILTFTVIGIILVIGIVIFFLRKNIGSSVDEPNNALDSIQEDDHDFSFFKSLRKVTSFYSRTGKNEVRLQFQKLQIFLEKRGYGRLSSETAEEWFGRLALLDDYSESVLATYYKARYNSSQITDEELASYINGIKDIKKKLSKKNEGGKKK